MSSFRAYILPAALVMVAMSITSFRASAQGWGNSPAPYYPGTTGYWTPGDVNGNWRASLYPAPTPVPAYVGHVYYTYQPFYPHQYLQPHYKFYHQSPLRGLFSCCPPRPNWSHVHVTYLPF